MSNSYRGRAASALLLLLAGLSAQAQTSPPPPPVASLAVSRVVATENSTVPVRITVQIDRAIDHDLPILLDLVGGNAVVGEDFLPPDAAPVIAAGSTMASVEFSIRDDEVSEGDERILIALVPGMGYAIGTPRTLEVLIRDDDANQADLQNRLQTLVANTPDPLIASQIETLGRLCANGLPPAGSDLAQRCARLRLALLDPAQARALVDSLRGLVAEELSSQRRGFRMLANGQLGSIGRRLEAVRFGGGAGLSLSGLTVDDQSLPLDGIGADEDGLLGRGLGLFVTGVLGRGERDASDLEIGFDTDTRSLLIGMDKRIGDRWVVGAAISHSRFEADLDLDAGSLDMDLDSVSVYASYSWDQGW
ncbi:MAG: autotransporter domain-containing protein, partial [Xanthomonadales bacterium]|nr:autotransporter domain-containing protein [Xanthomonadales bacterium]